MNLQPENSLVDESHAKILFGFSLRKFAHVGLFGVLGFSAFGFFQSFPMATIMCFIWAIVDEVHQLLCPFEMRKAADLFIDAIGFLLAIVLFVVGRKIYKLFFKEIKRGE